MAMLDPGDLIAFLNVATHRSFTRAAAQMGVSPSALSHAIRSAEARVGLRLFNRTTRSVALTEAGQRLFDRIGPAFRDIADAVEDLNSFRGKPAGSLRINASRAAYDLVLAPILARFVAAFPDIQVEIVADNALSDVVGAGFDAGVRLGEALALDMIAAPIGPRQRSAVVGSPALFETHGRPRTPHDLRGLPCIRYRFLGGAFYDWEFEKDGVALAVAVAGPLTVSSQDLMVGPAIQGAGLAYVFEGQVAAQLEAGTLIRALEDWCPDYPGFFLYYPGRRHPPAALRAFLDFVQADNRAGSDSRTPGP